MTYRGHTYRSLDAKGRLMLPPEYRSLEDGDSAEGAFMLTNFDGCVVGYPLSEWERIEDSFNQINMLDSRLRNFQRFFISGAMDVKIDKQGRILVPPHLRKYAGLDRDVVVAGVGRKFEIWNQETFEAKRREMEESFDDDLSALAEQGFELRI
ncbi:division/cell wall cluster transcriptional repressor MraZ [Desulfobaculum bizertense]|nr:division/cell wall cluster transcriptional repressor MraZ [Desulfobaculum bizertense]UIJ39466.1 division/cell wall cluster transcriptional repressor MraZ [Desulfobaculum bizertense]